MRVPSVESLADKGSYPILNLIGRVHGSQRSARASAALDGGISRRYLHAQAAIYEYKDMFSSGPEDMG